MYFHPNRGCGNPTTAISRVPLDQMSKTIRERLISASTFRVSSRHARLISMLRPGSPLRNGLTHRRDYGNEGAATALRVNTIALRGSTLGTFEGRPQIRRLDLPFDKFPHIPGAHSRARSPPRRRKGPGTALTLSVTLIQGRRRRLTPSGMNSRKFLAGH